ncbi:MAG TPA: flagellar hook capping FlgD N-terminal domain-containing protein [Solirubrobacteraceae bacterium]|nr:flagellar hook capping FlgD N-terminal domain-containing protein [Solirubrobacteraceae bacterium]
MSTVTPTTATGTTTQSSSTTNTSATSSLLGKDQFLQLMMAELKNQNPMSPNSSDPTQYVTELAQFTALEQQTNTAQSTAQSAQANQATQALALLGHTVSYIDPSGNSGTGVVQKVDFATSGPTLTVNGDSGIQPSGVSEVS